MPSTQDSEGGHNQTSLGLYTSQHHTNQQLYPEYQMALPADFSLFIFGHPSLPEGNHVVYTLLCDLYHILSIAATSHIAPLTSSTYEYILSQHRHLLFYISDQDAANTDDSISIFSSPPGNADDLHIAPLRLSVFILTSCLLCRRDEKEEGQAQNLARLAARLRALLTAGSRDDAIWMPFLGALIWCRAIGLRFADRHDRTWFVMQFLCSAQNGVLKMWEETSRCMDIIVCSLERIGPGRRESG